MLSMMDENYEGRFFQPLMCNKNKTSAYTVKIKILLKVMFIRLFFDIITVKIKALIIPF